MTLINIIKSNATINVGSHANYRIVGDNDTILVGANSVVSAFGSALRVRASGSGDTVNIGGNGAGASDANLDYVMLALAGLVNVLANSRVDITVSNSKIALAGSDTVGLYGSGDVVTANGGGNGVWIGQNGQNATGAAIDIVHGLIGGRLYEMQGSNVKVDGAYYTASLNGDDTLTASGKGVHIDASGPNDVLTIGGNGRWASNADDNAVVFHSAGTIYVTANSRVDITASNTEVTLAGADTLGLHGAGDVVYANGVCDSIWIGQNGLQVYDPVDYVHGLNGGSLFLLQQSTVDVDGANYSAFMNGYASLTATGDHNRFAVAGAANTLGFVNSGANTVTMADNASLDMGGISGSGQNKFYMGANDSLAFLDAGEATVYVPVSAGDAWVSYLPSDDVLQLASHFSSINDLLAHTKDTSLPQFGINEVQVQLSAAGDRLNLEGMNLTSFTAYANSGHLKFA